MGLKEIDVDNVKFLIRKSTRLYFRRAKIKHRGNDKFEIIITNQEKWFSEKDMVTVLNHEFLHWILCNTIGVKWGLKKYDKFLTVLGLYYHEVLMDTKL